MFISGGIDNGVYYNDFESDLYCYVSDCVIWVIKISFRENL